MLQVMNAFLVLFEGVNCINSIYSYSVMNACLFHHVYHVNFRGGCTCRWKTGNKVCKVNKNGEVGFLCSMDRRDVHGTECPASFQLNECKDNNSSMEYDGCIDYTDEVSCIST